MKLLFSQVHSCHDINYSILFSFVNILTTSFWHCRRQRLCTCGSYTLGPMRTQCTTTRKGSPRPGQAFLWCVGASPSRLPSHSTGPITHSRTSWSSSSRQVCWEFDIGKHSRLSISRTRISRILINSKRLFESKTHFHCFLQPLFFTSSKYPKCKLICTSDNFNM